MEIQLFADCKEAKAAASATCPTASEQQGKADSPSSFPIILNTIDGPNSALTKARNLSPEADSVVLGVRQGDKAAVHTLKEPQVLNGNTDR